MAQTPDRSGTAASAPPKSVASPVSTPAAPALGSPSPLLVAAGRLMQRTPTWGWLLGVIAATLLAYGPCVNHAFFLDDFWHLAKARQTQAQDLWRPWQYAGREDFKAYWFAATRVHDKREPGFFRPLVTVVYYTGLKLWGGRPEPFHALSVLCHVATTAALFWLLKRLLGVNWAAALGAAVGGIHPSHYEAVAWIAANADALAACLATVAIASFNESVQHRREGWGRVFYVLALVCFALSLAAKEMVVTVPAVLLAVEAWHLRAAGRRWNELPRLFLRWHLPFAAVLGAYLAWRIPASLALMQLKAGSNYAVDVTGPLALPAMLLNFAFYMGQLLLLYPVFPIDFAREFGGHCYWLAALAAAGLALVAWRLPRACGPAADTARLGMAWFTVSLLPFCFLTPGMRVLHYPAGALALVVAALALGVAQSPTLTARRRWQAGVAAGLFAALCLAATASYVSTMGYVSGQIRQIADDLDTHLDKAPVGAEVYLINLWQPAWFSERLVEVRRPQQRLDVQVLSFNPSILPPALRRNPGPMVRWFQVWFPHEAQEATHAIAWPQPGVLTVGVPGNVFFRGVVENALPVAPEARKMLHPVAAERFKAVPTAGRDGHIEEVTFLFPRQGPAMARLFLKLDGSGRWERLEPPAGWEAGADARP